MLNQLAKVLVVSLWLLPLSAHALGLGELKLQSALSQPFDAVISVVGVRPGDEDTLRVGLASVAEHRLAGLERSFIYSALHFNLVSQPNGEVAIAITSTQPINEPFLDFLVQITWAQGRLVREYTVFLDPPVIQRPVVKAIQPAEATESSPGTSPPPSIESSATGQVSPGGDYGPVQPGDTLWRIATAQQRAADASLNQVMLAIVRANPHAFTDGNANNLRAGVVLRIPEADAFAEVSASDAREELKTQTAVWRQQRPAGRLASTSDAGSGKVVRSETSTPDSVGKPEDEADRSAQDVLRLVRSEDAAATVSNTGAASGEVPGGKNQELLLLEEQLDSKQRENDELRQRISKLEAQLATMQAMADMVPPGEKAGTDVSEPLEAEAIGEVEEAPGEEDAGAEVVGKSEEETEAVAPGSAEKAEPGSAPGADAATVEEPVVEEEPVSTPPKSVAPEQPVEPGLVGAAVNWIMSNLLVAGGAILLAVLAGALLRRGRKEDIDEEADSLASPVDENKTLIADVGLDATEVSASQKPAAPIVKATASDEAEEDDFFKDFVSPTSTASTTSAEIEDVDPIAEADVYLTYGRYEQAEEILQDAVQYDPERVELKLKLLEVIYAQGKGEEFVTTVAANKAQLSDDSNWEQIKAMGFKLVPENPLFASGGDYQGELGVLVASKGIEQDMLDLEAGDVEEGESSDFVDSLSFDDLEGESADANELTADLDLDDFSGEFNSTSLDLAAVPDLDPGVTQFDETATIITESSAPTGDGEGITLDIDSDLPAEDSPSIVEWEDDGGVLEFESPTAEAAAVPEKETVAADNEEGLSLDFSETISTLQEEKQPVTPDIGLPTDSGLELDFSTGEDGMTLEFDDAPLLGAEPGAERNMIEPEALEIEGDGGLEFEFDSEESLVDSEDLDDGLDATVIRGVGEGIDLAAEDFSETMPSLDAVSSKLDLLAAYVEMGDRDAADTVGKEIMEFGDEEQKQQAKDLLAQLD